MFDWQIDFSKKLAETIVQHIDQKYLRTFLSERGIGWEVTSDRDDGSTTVLENTDLVADLHHYMVRSNVTRAVQDILRKEDLVTLANIATEEAYEYSLHSDPEEMLNTILTTNGLALTYLPGSLPSLGQYRFHINRIKDQLMQYGKDTDIPDGTLRGLSLDGWSYLELLLALTVFFLAEVLDEYDGFRTSGLQSIIARTLSLPGLGSLIRQGLKEINTYVTSGDSPQCEKERYEPEEREKERIRADVELQRKKEEHNFIKLYWKRRKEAETRVRETTSSEALSDALKNLEKEWEEKRSESLDYFKEKASQTATAELATFNIVGLDRRRRDKEIAGRNSKVFQGLLSLKLNRNFLFDESHLNQVAELTFHRNIYAHRDVTQLEALGINNVLASINALSTVVDLLDSYTLCPDLIVIVGVGRDVYGREIVYYVRDRDLDPTKPIRPTTMRWMFKPHTHAMPFRPYYLLSHQHYGAYDPFMVDALTISNKLQRWQATRR